METTHPSKLLAKEMANSYFLFPWPMDGQFPINLNISANTINY